jgi:hypothetical protein
MAALVTIFVIFVGLIRHFLPFWSIKSPSGRPWPFPALLASGQEDEAAGVEDGEEKIPQDDRQLIDVERIDQRYHASPEAEVPKEIRHDQLLALLRIKPLDDESQAEHQVADEAKGRPKFRFMIEPRHNRAKKGFKKSRGVSHIISPFFA